MPRLIAFGDSMTWGTDLQDCRDIPPTPSNNTWPALLAQALDHEYVCLAFPGIGNDAIARFFANYLGQIQADDTVVVNWTWIDRWEYFDSTAETYMTCVNTPDQVQWIQVLPNSQDKHSMYWRDYHSELADKLRSLKNIMLVMQQLDAIGCRQIHTCTDVLVRDRKFHAPTYITNLQDFVVPRLTWFDDLGFLDWSKQQGFDISPGWHPLEHAHRVARDTMITQLGL